MNKKFANRENECINLDDGRTVWLSRSCAVTAEICLYNLADKTWYILLGKRGQGTPDFQGFWGLPCGYLDWDETLYQGMIREVWEECGLHLPDLPKKEGFVYSKSECFDGQTDTEITPWSIADKPSNNNQNISFNFAVIFSWRGQDFPDVSIENCEPNEVDAVEWVSIETALTMSLAFNHNNRISKLLKEKPDWFRDVEKIDG